LVVDSLYTFMFDSKKKEQQKTLTNQKKVKTTIIDFERIALYFGHSDKSDAYPVIDDNTLNDVDFEEIFISMDRTSSVIGQQYLYATLRTIPNTPNQPKELEHLINTLNGKPEKSILQF